jgi:hypothetical protein
MQRRTFEIISAPLVEWLRTQNFPMRSPPIRFYPDGSLWTDDHRLLIWKNTPGGVQAVQQLIHHKLPGAYGSCRFRMLAPFGGDWQVAPNYSLTYPGAYSWLVSEFDVNELSTLMYPGICRAASEDEYDLAHVRVLVRLYRKVTQGIAEQLARALRQWFTEIGSVGVFGEAGVSSISSELRYRGREAGFEIDASGSGQETLNTLYLAILNWCMDRSYPLALIDLAPDRNEKVFASKPSVLIA